MSLHPGAPTRSSCPPIDTSSLYYNALGEYKHCIREIQSVVYRFRVSALDPPIRKVFSFLFFGGRLALTATRRNHARGFRMAECRETTQSINTPGEAISA